MQSKSFFEKMDPFSISAPKAHGKNGSWTFLTNHCHVLVCLHRDPDMRVRDIADAVGITERAVHRIMRDLVSAGAVSRARDGRRKHYQLNSDLKLRHPLEAHCTIHSLLEGIDHS